jgi:primosomal protein N' (replication factor Y)
MRGFGTEKIEEDLALFFPQARIERLDLDAVRSRKAYEMLIARFEARASDILVGTQMVSKGLDFDNVRLVGIMNADTMLSYPDFRAHERSYQLMAQVSGRAGRKNSRGKVIIQGSDHNHPIIKYVVENGYIAMYNDQVAERKKFGYPPFSRLVEVMLRHRQKEVVDSAAAHLAIKLKEVLGEKVMGPEYPLVSRIQNYHLKRLLVKIQHGKRLTQVKQQLAECVRELNAMPDFRQVRITLDVDPY